MLIGVVSDTHGHMDFARCAARMLQGFELAAVVHCGDIGSADIVGVFGAWPTHFVFGNVDRPPDALRGAIAAAKQTCHERFGQLELADRRIAFLHGDDAERLSATVHSGQYDLVCYGHTHLAEQHRVVNTLVLNPGALYRANPHSLAIVDLVKLDATHIPL